MWSLSRIRCFWNIILNFDLFLIKTFVEIKYSVDWKICNHLRGVSFHFVSILRRYMIQYRQLQQWCRLGSRPYLQIIRELTLRHYFKRFINEYDWFAILNTCDVELVTLFIRSKIKRVVIYIFKSDSISSIIFIVKENISNEIISIWLWYLW